MFHQFFWASSALHKMGAPIPVLNRLNSKDRRLATCIALVMAMGSEPASGDCQRAFNEILHEIYLEFDLLDKPFHKLESPALQDALALRAAIADDFGAQDRCCCCIAFTDDPDNSICGPPARVERSTFANHCVLGPNGVNMLLADESKWMLSTHLSWLGVHTSPMLGIAWFSMEKRLKAINSINDILAGSANEEMALKTISFLQYVVSVCHWHSYLVRPL